MVLGTRNLEMDTLVTGLKEARDKPITNLHTVRGTMMEMYISCIGNPAVSHLWYLKLSKIPVDPPHVAGKHTQLNIQFVKQY